MADEKFKITIDGVEYGRIEDVPEQYRSVIQRQLESVRTTTQAAEASASGVNVKKHFNFSINIKHSMAPGSGTLLQGVSEQTPSVARGLIAGLVLALLGLVVWVLRHRG